MLAPVAPHERTVLELPVTFTIADHAGERGFLNDWQGLMAVCAHVDPFLTPEWVVPWLKTQGRSACLIVGRQSGRLVAVIPARRYPGVVLLGGHVSSEQQYLGLFREQLLKSPFSVAFGRLLRPALLCLDMLAEADRPGYTLVKGLVANGWLLQREAGKESPYVIPTDDFDTYLSQRKRSVRREYARRRRKMAAELMLCRQLITTRQELEEWLPRMIALEQVTWKYQQGVFKPRRRSRTLARLRALAESDRLRILLLRSAKRLIAFDIEILYGKRLWSYAVSFDPRYRAYGPGIDLQVEAIRHGFNESLASVELLGANQGYKRAWSHGSRQRASVYLYSPGAMRRIGPLLLNTIKRIRKGWRK